jgi:hypothetical protein
MISAIAIVDGVQTDHAAGNYNVPFEIAATDGTTDIHSGGAAYIPLGTGSKKANAAIRQAMADFLQTTYGWTIDPNDIFIPFS